MKVSLLMHHFHKAAQTCKDNRTPLQATSQAFATMPQSCSACHQCSIGKHPGYILIFWTQCWAYALPCTTTFQAICSGCVLLLPWALYVQHAIFHDFVTFTPLSVYAECCHLRPASNSAYAASRSPSGAELVALASGSGLVNTLPWRSTCGLCVCCPEEWVCLLVTNSE